MKITIFTLNVNAYRDCRSLVQYWQLIRIIESHNADIICLQENCNSNMVNPFQNYNLVTSCYTNENIENTIFIKKKKAFVKGYSIDITENCPVQRCASFVTIKPDVTVANIHLCGGRFDDKKYKSMGNTKANEITTVVKQKPDFIVGDFNAEANRHSTLSSLNHYPLFTRLSQQDKRLFYQYYTSHHSIMTKYGYKVCPLHGVTSVYDGTPDHIYYRKDAWVPLDIKVIEMLDYTDHNAILTVFASL